MVNGAMRRGRCGISGELCSGPDIELKRSPGLSRRENKGGRLGDSAVPGYLRCKPSRPP